MDFLPRSQWDTGTVTHRHTRGGGHRHRDGDGGVEADAQRIESTIELMAKRN